MRGQTGNKRGIPGKGRRERGKESERKWRGKRRRKGEGSEDKSSSK